MSMAPEAQTRPGSGADRFRRVTYVSVGYARIQRNRPEFDNASIVPQLSMPVRYVWWRAGAHPTGLEVSAEQKVAPARRK